MDYVIALIVLVFATATLFTSVRNRRAQSKTAPENIKPWERPRPKPLSPEQVKALGYMDRADSFPNQHSNPRTFRLPPEKRNLVFVYTDADENTSVRELTRWSDDGKYLKGYCLRANEVRTFRRDRIGTFIEGDGQLQPPSRIARRPKKIEVLFTGFTENIREDLENVAEEADMKVRKSVTKKLAFLVAGPNAGPSKRRDAEKVGAIILNEDEFFDLLETGALPAGFR